MLVPTGTQNQFDVIRAEQVPRQGYAEVIPEAFNVEYSVNRLEASLIDVNGNPVRNNTEYVVAILVVGKSNLQLSEFSAPFELLDQPIYSGIYVFDWRATILSTSFIFPDEPPCEETVHFSWFETTLSFKDGFYIGEVICTEINGDNALCESGSIFNGSIILEIQDQGIKFSFLKASGCYYENVPDNVPDPLCRPCLNSDTSCQSTFVGSGLIEDELIFNIDYTGDDCVGSHVGVYQLTRVTESEIP